jgi:ketosteroid isomerase-like protein
VRINDVSTHEVISAYVGAMRKGDRDEAFALFADDVVGHVPGRSVLSGELNGRAAVEGYINGVIAKGHGKVQVDVLDILVGEEHAALLVREQIGDDPPLDIRRANVYRVRDGRISEIWIFEHDQYTVDEWIATLWPSA